MLILLAVLYAVSSDTLVGGCSSRKSYRTEVDSSGRTTFAKVGQYSDAVAETVESATAQQLDPGKLA